MRELLNNRHNEPHSKNTTESIIKQNEVRPTSRNQRMSVRIYARQSNEKCHVRTEKFGREMH